ncbi:MAG: sigma-70 family RNA polymerase sigma factor [Planctomycetes bacterium]|nr:sigma-70 family RNA polymerase sigma factor [Planctomycetota bacterium]
MAPPVDKTLENLIAKASWIRQLARALVRDADAADDLVQEAWVAALERGPEPDKPFTRWIAAVMRNFARDRWRGEVRRAATERAAARPEQQDDAALEQLDAHALLVDAVRGLGEPYRTTIVMRFLEELSPQEVATRTGVPLRTVHTRTTRALAQLRAKLDGRVGDRRAWLACLAPLLKTPGTPLLGALLVNTKLVGVAVAVAVVSTAGWWLTRAPDVAALESASDARRANERPIEVAANTPNAERAEVSTPAPKASKSSAQSALPPEPVAAFDVPLHGVVIGVDDAPIAGLEVEILADTLKATDARPRARCDSRGAFVFEQPPREGLVRVATVGYTTVFEPTFNRANGALEFVLVAAPSADFSGRVVDTAGAPIAKAEVAANGAYEVRSQLARTLEGSRMRTWTVATDADGRFALSEVPLLSNGKLYATCAGYGDASLPEPERSTDSLLFTLTQGAFALAGQVVFPDGRPCPDAWVALGEAGVHSDADGRFRIEPRNPDIAGHAELQRTLRAVTKGWLPVKLECARASIEDSSAWPTPLVLTLQREAPAIRGRVLDADGKPVPKAQVSIVDGEYAGLLDHRIDGIAFATTTTYEQLIAGSDWDRSVTASEDGTFELDGLQDHSYVLRANDTRSVALVESTSIVAGTDGVVLRFAKEPRKARIAGIVESLHGKPVPHAAVRLNRDVRGLDGRPKVLIQSEAVLCDDEGRFEFRDVASAVTFLSVEYVQLPLDGATDLEALHIVVPQQTHARIELSPNAAAAEGFRFLDADGKTVPIVVDHGGVSFACEQWIFSEGRSETLSIVESATTLVLLHGTEEVQRVPVRLDLDTLNVIRP